MDNSTTNGLPPLPALPTLPGTDLGNFLSKQDGVLSTQPNSFNSNVAGPAISWLTTRAVTVIVGLILIAGGVMALATSGRSGSATGVAGLAMRGGATAVNL